MSTDQRDPAVTLHASVTEIDAADWESVLPGAADALGYFAAVEAAPPPNFGFGAISARSGGDLLALAPVFSLDYRLDTSLRGWPRRVTQWIGDRAPLLVSLKMAAIGSPLLDNLTLGFAPHLETFRRREIFAGFLATLEAEASLSRRNVVVAKSLDEDQAALLHDALVARGYHRITALPTVLLDLPFATFDDYLMSLGKKRRSNFRQKLRSLKEVRFERRSSAAGIEEALYRLFESTRTHSKGRYNEFEELNPGYFQALSEKLGDRLQIMLFWQGEELLAMLTLLVGKDRIIARDFGMRYPEGRELNLYFLAFLETIRFAIEHRIATLDMGATTYETKLQFGGRLDRKWLYLKFRRALANRVLGPLASAFDFERNDPELAGLRARLPTGPPPRP